MSFPQLLRWWIHFSHEVLQLRASAPPGAFVLAQQAVQNLSKNQITVTACLVSISRVTLVPCQSPAKLWNEEGRALYGQFWWQVPERYSAWRQNQLPSGFWPSPTWWRAGQWSLCHENWSRELISLPLVDTYNGSLHTVTCVNSTDQKRSLGTSLV